MKSKLLTVAITIITIVVVIGIFVALNKSNNSESSLSKDEIYKLIGKEEFESTDDERSIEIQGDVKSIETGWYFASVSIQQAHQHPEEDTEEDNHNVSAILVIYVHENYPPELIIDPFDYYTFEELKQLVAPETASSILEKDMENIYESTE